MNIWRTIDEILLLDIPDFPRERSALSRKAQREQWSRRRRETAKRGVTYEYLLPSSDRSDCTGNQDSVVMDHEGLLRAFKGQLEVLTTNEIDALLIQIKRKGVEILLYLLDEDNIRLMQLDAIVKEKILGKQSNAAEAVINAERSRECDPSGQEQNTTESLALSKRQAG